MTAEAAAWDRGRRPKPSRLASNLALLADVRGRLEEDWSPEQIAAWLRREHPTDPTRWVSHETIYRTIYLAGRRELGARAARHLRSGRSVRHPRRGGGVGARRFGGARTVVPVGGLAAINEHLFADGAVRA